MSNGRYHVISKEPRICQCGEPFIPRNSKHKYCEECGERISKEQKNKKAKTYFQKYPFFDTPLAHIMCGDRQDGQHCKSEFRVSAITLYRGGKVSRKVIN